MLKTNVTWTRDYPTGQYNENIALDRVDIDSPCLDHNSDVGWCALMVIDCEK